MDLCQVIYSFLATQIQFGTYRCGDRLPTMEEASQQMLVSFDTVRIAYRHLQADGFINLSQSIGTTVKVKYSEEEIAKNIQKFYAQRSDALHDLSQSMRVLFGNIQWFALKKTSPQRLDEIDSLLTQKKDILLTYTQHLQLIYGSLNNELLMRLVWQTFMFFQAPFLSIPDNLAPFVENGNPLLEMTEYCRQKSWTKLRRAVDDFQDLFPRALHEFYEKKIHQPPAEKQISFAWSSYKKSSQLCYTLAQNILSSISQGEYPCGSYLPSLEKLAKEKQVSVSTIRRTLAILSQVGAVKSVNGIGTKVLPLDKSSENLDLSQPAVQKRLLAYIQCLQLFALTSRMTAKSTLDSLSAEELTLWKDWLCKIKHAGRHELTVYASFKFIALHAPFQAVRTVYFQLLRLLYWGHLLRGIRGNQADFNRFFLPHLEALIGYLEQRDTEAFSARLEALAIRQLNFTAGLLDELGLPEAALMSVPEEHII